MEFGGIYDRQNVGQEDTNRRGLRSRSHIGLKQIKVRKEIDDESGEEKEPLSPMARMFHEPESDVYIIVIVGFKSPIEPSSFKANLVETLLKHPRFSSVQVADDENGRELKWVQTKVDIDKHVIVPMVDQVMASSSDKYVEDYVANISKTKISMSIPMWDCHILNLKTCDAESTLVIRVHHSLGDGTSLMSLLVSCSRKVSDPDALPTFPAMKKPRSAGWFWRFWSVLVLIWNTLVDMGMCVATTYFLKDTQTPLKAPSSTVAFTSRRIVRRAFCLDDVKLVKNATNTTVNDVMLAITQAGLSRYLNKKYGGEARGRENNFPNNIRLRATLFINLRSSPGDYALAEMAKKNSKAEWGNKIGYVLFPFTIALKDKPLDYIRDAKATMDRKKATLEAKFRLFMAKFFVRFCRTKLATFPLTTMWFSNMAGPLEEISIFGNQVSFIAPSLYGQPVALTIHVVSYAKKITMVLSVDDNIIPDPYQLCDDFEESLKLFKNSVTAEGLILN
ncbi:O-acyltransferase WSD1-like [Durio zibethinus]|uniref:O-acyltransferase WSD1-like n=1 Tax=Durio zibethinus TaxID=66656 RepID=A0A6P5WWE8_DURZI|nr:O-acyltransferase WSD1-like [Durio zibethinus]